jgi:hypothetical protein
LPELVIRKAGTGQRQNRKISFAFPERMNSWALMVALTGEGFDGYCPCQILDFLVTIPAVSNADNKNHKFLVENIEYNPVLTDMERIKGGVF